MTSYRKTGLGVALSILGLWWASLISTVEAQIDANPMTRIYANPSITFSGCKDLPDMFTKCKRVSRKESLCSADNVFPTVYSTWEQNPNCKGIDYYNRAAEALKKQSAFVWNITNNWTTFFDNRAQSILSASNPMFLCSYAAKKWRQVNDLSFFRNTWQPKAIRCSNYLANARRSMMCSMCDPTDQLYYSVKNYIDPRDGSSKTDATVVNLSYQTCQSFLENCVGYIESKQKVIDKLNVEFTLGLCDKDGIYLALNNHNYKKILPSAVTYDEEHLQNCKQYMQKDPTTPQEILANIEASCTSLCERYYSWTAAMMMDDFLNLKYLQYMHNILKEIVSGKFIDSMFNNIIPTDPPTVLDFGDVYFQFESSNSADGLNLNKHLKDNDFKEFDSSQYIKSARILGVSLLLGLALLC